MRTRRVQVLRRIHGLAGVRTEETYKGYLLQFIGHSTGEVSAIVEDKEGCVHAVGVDLIRMEVPSSSFDTRPEMKVGGGS